MADLFHRTGSDVYFKGYKVAVLCDDVPATILDAAEEALDAYDSEAISAAEHEEVLAGIEKEHARELDEKETETDELQRRVRDLEARLAAAQEGVGDDA